MGSSVIGGSGFPTRVLVRGALVLAYVGVLGAGATIWRELKNSWDIANLPLWQRPVANGISFDPLQLTAFAAALLLVVHFAGRDDYLSRCAALFVLIGGAVQLTMGLGLWFLVLTVDDRVFGTMGAGRTRLDLGQWATRAPNVTLALLTVVAATALLRAPREAPPAT